jgi:hypothetical protein
MTTDYGSNLITNPTLQTTTSGWTASSGTSLGTHSTYGGHMDSPAGSANRNVAYTSVSVTAGQFYSLSGVQFRPHHVSTDPARFGLKVEWRNSSNAVVGTTWTQTYTLAGADLTVQTMTRQEFTAPATATTVRVYVYTPDTTNFDHYATNFVFKKAGNPPTADLFGPTTAQVGGVVTLEADGGYYNPVFEGLSGAPWSPNSPFVDQINAGPFPSVGSYTYKVTTKDVNGLTNTDTHTVTVSAGSPPVANAGPDRVIVAGGSTTLNGSATAANGLHASPWQWTEVSTSGVPITASTSQNTAVGPFPDEGVYTFNLRATDTTGLVDDDTVTVTVQPAPSGSAPYAERIRLELLAEARNNKISNHSGQAGVTTGWTATTGSVSAVSISSGNGGKALRLTLAGDGRGRVQSSTTPVVPGQWLTAGFTANASASTLIGVVLEALDGSGNVIETDYGNTKWLSNGGPDTEVKYFLALQVPVGAVSVRMAVATLNNTPSTPGSYVYWWNSFLFVGGSAAEVRGFSFPTDGENWQNLISDSISMSIDRGGDVNGVVDQQKVGLLTARLTNSASTPEQNELMRPGHIIRATAFDRTSGEFTYLFRGKISEASSDWSAKKPLVTITATDPVGELSNYPVNLVEGGTFADRVNSVMDTVSVEYEVHDTATSAPTGLPVSFDESGTALTQLDLITNTEHGQWFAGKNGVLQIRALNSVTTAGSALFSDDPMDTTAIDFYDADVSFDSKSLVNSLTVSQKAFGEDSEDATYGPFSVVESIQDWGIQKADVQVNDYTADYHADYFLGTWSTPKLTCRSIKFSVEDEIHKATGLEILQAARVKFGRAGLDDYFRILSIKHDITPQKWDVEVTFRPLEAHSSVTVANPPWGTDGTPSDDVPEEYQADTGWKDFSYVSGYTDGGGTPGQMRSRRIGKTCFIQGGASGSFTAGSYTKVSNSPVPEHMRPEQIYRTGVQGNGGRSCALEVRTDGHIYVCPATGVSGVTWIATSGSWSVG